MADDAKGVTHDARSAVRPGGVAEKTQGQGGPGCLRRESPRARREGANLTRNLVQAHLVVEVPQDRRRSRMV
eukprot:4369084-Alexandrium_andersonii.AAC.1